MTDADTLVRLKAELAEWPNLQMALLFGSVARNQATADSDLDLAVQMHKPLTAEQKIALITHLAEVFGRPVDVIDLREAGQPLLSEIVSTGVLVHGSSKEKGDLLFRSIMDQEDFGANQQRILRGRQKQWIEH
ncbi:type VII toxin-antitoxin system MntA family adenylyltransferase antitoxin [Saccharospirillum salsuginis]|uniref:Polymerase beta nucleotidyltransferase domain-containing protein n=1 Tax=Saccharospirillum salsuginis TaxID=418750 RepID=A0A918KDX8_9GAMM|nr:nucleotidyltransferase domain-containing protein [Saccharospirillum salsuginis]GGX60111.1 hypothetical protein GCM10007392_30150 [Saccharospirillum salsuginis]